MRVAAAQTAPAWGNAPATAAKAAEWIEKAAAEDVSLVAFGEVFLSGYPFWVARTDGARWDAPDQKEAYAFYVDAAVRLDGPELAHVTEAVRDTGVFAFVGVTERSMSGGTVYATMVAIDPDAGIVGRHRKTMPTFEERMVWGTGDGYGLRVHETGGIRVGGLNCWENWVPVARHSLYAQGIDLHVAIWPGSVGLTQDITRFIAKEGRCYVLSAGALLTQDAIPAEFPIRDAALADAPEMLYDGGSAVAGPDGSWVAEPVSGEERLVIADIDLARVRGERQNFDPAGHYFRSDVFGLTVDRKPLEPAEFVE
jgi:nitrilase